MPGTPQKINVAILGGGMGSLAAAWVLTDPALGGAFDVTVYQKDWLLGGKGASTRGRLDGQRIQEHGVHLLLGFYDQALRLLRQVYNEVRAKDPTAVPAFDDAIAGWDRVWMAEQYPLGTWLRDPWLAHFPPNGASPGVRAAGTSWPDLVRRAVADLQNRLFALGTLQVNVQLPSGIPDAIAHLADLIIAAANSGKGGGGTLAATLLKLGIASAKDAAAKALTVLLEAAWAACKPLLAHDDVRHAWIAIYLLATNLLGLVKDEVIVQGTDALDAQDYRDWLKGHQPPKLDTPPYLSYWSPPVRALYDLAFSRRTGLAAGVTLMAGFRLVFDYAGHFLYKMQGGMGEIVFAPLYLALSDRNVNFCFFHEVTRIGTAQENGVDVVSEIDFSVPKGVTTSTTSLQKVTGSDGTTLQCWPGDMPMIGMAPHESLTLKKGTDFDVVVLGISVGALDGSLAQELRQNKGFDDMVTHASTVATQAAQIWMTDPASKLGWQAAERAMLISYERPFNSWVDMSHLMGKEDWSAVSPRPVAVHYLCDELAPGEGTTEVDVRQSLEAWIENKARIDIWPGFAWGMVYDPQSSAAGGRLEAQYIRANQLGSERYVTVAPKSKQYRLAPGGTGFRNLAIAGDWVLTELSCGCLESATQGGIGAGQAIIDGTVRK